MEEAAPCGRPDRPLASGSRKQSRGWSGSRRSILGELIVRIAIQPAFAGLGGRDDRVPGRAGVLGRMAVRRAVAAVRAAAFLAGSQMNPRSADLDALLALASFRRLDARDRVDVVAGLIGHDAGY